jgi:ribosome recycling factor
MSDEYLEGMKDDFKQTLGALKQQLTSVRTGRATPQLLDSVQVHVAAYGSNMPLNQLASISVGDARLLVVNPWDKGTISEIEKAIRSAGLGLNPANDGQVIRVPIPALTGERRQDLVKTVRRMTEETRIRARHVRREYLDIFKELQGDSEITEDDLKRYEKQIQEATDAAIKGMDSMAAEKEQEVLEV